MTHFFLSLARSLAARRLVPSRSQTSHWDAPSTAPLAPSRTMTLVDALKDTSRPVFLFGASRSPSRRAAREARRDSRRRRG